MKKKNKVEVSVIIPNFNYGQYIEQCINSVLESEFHLNMLEIIIVDDASTDNSISIIEQIENNTKAEIHLVKQSANLGLAKARNAGIKKASGNYLFFLDSDNYIDKSCLKIHYDFLSKNAGFAACYAPIQKFDDRSGRMLDVFSSQEYDYDKLLYGNYIDAMAMIKKDDLIAAGLYDEHMPYSGWEDYELWLRMGSKDKKVCFIEGKPLSGYRVHPDSMIRNLGHDAIITLSAYISEKYALKTLPDNNVPSHTKIQVFWAGTKAVFLEDCSAVQFVRLSDTAKTLKFEIGTFHENIEFIRFDLGDEVGLINVHGITIKDNLLNLKWSWDQRTLHAQQNLVLLENKKLWQDSILQVSRSVDPAFIITTSNAVKELSSSGIVIEITLSGPDPRQLNFLETHTRPLTCLSENEFTELEKHVAGLKVEKNELLTQVAIQTSRAEDLKKGNDMLLESNITFQQFNKQLNEDKINLNNDKLLLSSELNFKSDLLIKATDKIAKLEGKLIEQSNKEDTLAEAHRNVVKEFNERMLSQKDLLQKNQDEHITQINLLREEIEKIRRTGAEQIQIQQEKITALNDQLAITRGKLNEWQLVCDFKEDRNKGLIDNNNRLEKEMHNLISSLSENVKQKQDLIASVNLHLACAERLVQEKNECAEKNVALQDQLSRITLDKQRIETLLSVANNTHRENEHIIKHLREDLEMFKNQKIITFIKGKINRKS